MNLVECDSANVMFAATPAEVDALWRICETARENLAGLDLAAYDLDPGDVEDAARYLAQVIHDPHDPLQPSVLKVTQSLFDSIYGTVGTCDEFRAGIDLETYGLDETLIRQMHERLRAVLEEMVERFEADASRG